VTNGTERSAAESVKSRDAMMLLDRDGPLLEFNRDDAGDCLNRTRHKKF
jgi:hypothetical protein